MDLGKFDLVLIIPVYGSQSLSMAAADDHSHGHSVFGRQKFKIVVNG